MELNPRRSLATRRQRAKAYTAGRGPRVEEGQAFEAALRQAAIAAADLSHELGDADRRQLYRGLLLEIELGRGTLVQQATVWR